MTDRYEYLIAGLNQGEGDENRWVHNIIAGEITWIDNFEDYDQK